MFLTLFVNLIVILNCGERLSHQQGAGLGKRLCNSEPKGGEVLDGESFHEISLRVDRDQLVLLIEVVEFEGGRFRHVEGFLRLGNKVEVVLGHLETLGLAEMRYLHNFLLVGFSVFFG